MTDIAFHIFPYKTLERPSKFLDKTIFERKQTKNNKKEDNVTGNTILGLAIRETFYIKILYY
jgi:hypothetical protein